MFRKRFVVHYIFVKFHAIYGTLVVSGLLGGDCLLRVDATEKAGLLIREINVITMITENKNTFLELTSFILLFLRILFLIYGKSPYGSS